MEQLAFEVMQTLDIGPLPVASFIALAWCLQAWMKRHSLQVAASINEHVTLINEDLVTGLHLDKPFGLLLVPDGVDDLVVIVHKGLDAILGTSLLNILQDLRRGGIVVWPIRVLLKAIAVVVGRNVALAAGIPVKL